VDQTIRRAALLWASAGAVVALATSGCGAVGSGPATGGTPSDQAPAASTAPASSAAPELPAGFSTVQVGPATYAWPVAELTVTSTPHGAPRELTAYDREVAASVVENSDGAERLEDVLESIRYQEALGAFFEQVRVRYPEQYSASANSDGRTPGWVALTGAVPDDLLPLADALPVAVELRGGAAMSDAERERALGPAIDAFTADVYPGGQRAGSGGGLDAPTALFEIDYAPNAGEEDGRNHADEDTLALMAQAATAAIGREVPYSARFTSDDRDPKSTEPAVWFLREGEEPGPTSTSVALLVDQRACVSESDPLSGIADPVVEETPTQVRIAIGAYLRKGPQGCGAPPLTPVVVELSAPLGDRTLVDVNGAVDDGPDGYPATGFQGGLVTPATP
jgi:hypothetical protein